jgi:hypothetical protein
VVVGNGVLENKVEAEEEEEEEEDGIVSELVMFFFLCADYNYFFFGVEDFLVRKWYGLIVSAEYESQQVGR